MHIAHSNAVTGASVHRVQCDSIAMNEWMEMNERRRKSPFDELGAVCSVHIIAAYFIIINDFSQQSAPNRWSMIQCTFAHILFNRMPVSSHFVCRLLCTHLNANSVESSYLTCNLNLNVRSLDRGQVPNVLCEQNEYELAVGSSVFCPRSYVKTVMRALPPDNLHTVKYMYVHFMTRNILDLTLSVLIWFGTASLISM